MKKIILVLALLIFGMTAYPALAGDSASGGINLKTGDAVLDATLGDLNVQTSGKNLNEFISNLSLSYKIPKIEIESLLVKVKMSPAEVYLTVGLASITKKPISVVVKEYKANKGKGWGVIAKRLGVKPGSKAFKALKNGGLTQLEKVKGKGKAKRKGKPKGKPNKGKKK